MIHNISMGGAVYSPILGIGEFTEIGEFNICHQNSLKLHIRDE